MAEQILSNRASASGTYNNVLTAMDSTAVVTVLLDGLEIAKAADKEVWVSGPLTYTITLSNQTEHPYENPVVTDVLNPTIVALVDASVAVNGAQTTNYTYDSATGTLVVNVPTIEVNGTAVVTFQVQKA